MCCCLFKYNILNRQGFFGYFIYNKISCRIAVFSVKVLRDERICVIAEQRPDCAEEEVLVCTIKYANVWIFFLSVYVVGK